MKDSPYEWMNYTPTISNEFIEQCENPNFEKLKKDIQIARAKDYLRDNDTKDGSEPCLEWCIISDLLRIIEINEQTTTKVKYPLIKNKDNGQERSKYGIFRFFK